MHLAILTGVASLLTSVAKSRWRVPDKKKAALEISTAFEDILGE